MKRLLPVILILFFTVTACNKTSTDPSALPGNYSNKAVGASAHDLLSSGTYTSLVIEMQYMKGYQLEPNALLSFNSFLNAICNKPGGITVIQKEIAANGGTLTQQQVEDVEKQNRTAYTSGTTLAVYVLITDGYNTDANTLGFAYRNTSVCLFGKNIADNSGGLNQVGRTTLQATVLEHEIGHLLGLVDLGTPMQVNHLDISHSNHCNNKACLMYYAVETNIGLGLLLGRPIAALDSNCRKDLHDFGGK